MMKKYRWGVLDSNANNAGKKESAVIPLDESIEVMKTMDELRSQWGFTFPSEK